MFICNEQHLSNIWGLNHLKKLSNTEAELKKIVVYKNMRVYAVDFCREKLHLECLTVSTECSLPINIFCFITEDFLSWKKAHNAWINPYSWVYFSRRCDWLKKGWASREGNGLSFTDRIAEQIVLVITQVWKESKLSIHSNLPKSETGKQGGFKNAAYAARNSELFMIWSNKL